MLRRILLAALVTAAGRAETPGEARATIGMASFLDESPVRHFEAGASVRIYLTRRLSAGPEFLYMRNGPRDQGFLLTPAVTFDLRRASARAAPYLTGGAGVLWSRQVAGTGGPHTAASTAWAAGAGARIYLTKRLFVAPEVRLGIEPLWQATGSIGWIWGR
jgi:hypothetical protein